MADELNIASANDEDFPIAVSEIKLKWNFGKMENIQNIKMQCETSLETGTGGGRQLPSIMQCEVGLSKGSNGGRQLPGSVGRVEGVGEVQQSFSGLRAGSGVRVMKPSGEAAVVQKDGQRGEASGVSGSGVINLKVVLKGMMEEIKGWDVLVKRLVRETGMSWDTIADEIDRPEPSSIGSDAPLLDMATAMKRLEEAGYAAGEISSDLQRRALIDVEWINAVIDISRIAVRRSEDKKREERRRVGHTAGIKIPKREEVKVQNFKETIVQKEVRVGSILGPKRKKVQVVERRVARVEDQYSSLEGRGEGLLSRDLCFNGDVARYVERAIGDSLKPIGDMTKAQRLKRNVLHASLLALVKIDVKKREYTPEEKLVEAVNIDEGVTSKVQSRSWTSSEGVKKVRKPDNSLVNRANRMARMLMGDKVRIISFMSAKTNDGKWKRAVGIAIKKFWEKGKDKTGIWSVREEGLTEVQDREFGRNAVDLVDLYANVKRGSDLEGNMETDVREDECGKIEEVREIQEQEVNAVVAAEAFVNLINSSHGDALRSRSVCAFCVYKRLNPVHGLTSVEIDIIGKRGLGAVEMMARKHNQEMHSLNGNTTSRSENVMKMKKEAWDSEGLVIDYSTDDVGQYEHYVRTLETYGYVNDINMTHTFVDNTGTLHQRIASLDNLRRAEIWGFKIPEIPAMNKDEEEQAYTVRVAYDRYEKEWWTKYAKSKDSEKLFKKYLIEEGVMGRHKEMMELVRGKCLWVSVGQNRNTSHGDVYANSNGVSATTAISDADSSNVIINDSRAHNIWAHLAGTPLVAGAAIQSMGGERHDWRTLGLKASLYELQMDPTWTDPTGMDYSFAKKCTRNTLRLKKSAGTPYRFVAMDMTALSSHLRKYNGVQVDVSEAHDASDLEMWHINDTNVKVIVLDDRLSGLPAALALWVLVHLRYPLMETYDVFEIHTHGGASSTGAERAPVKGDVMYKRNASAVEIMDEATDILLLTTDKAMRRRRVAGVDIDIQLGERYYRDIGPVPVQDAADLIDGCLDMIMGYGGSIRGLLNGYLMPRMGTGMNWGEIEQMVGVLVTRYLPKDEYVRDESSEKIRSVWASTTYTHDGVELFKLDDYARAMTVTAMDQIPAARSMAKVAPVLSVGCWNNVTELAVMLGLGDYVGHNVEDKTTVKKFLESSGHDKIMRMRRIRQAIEEWKESTGTTDEIVDVKK